MRKGLYNVSRKSIVQSAEFVNASNKLVDAARYSANFSFPEKTKSKEYTINQIAAHCIYMKLFHA